ncbi:MAG: HAD hydrolase family protein [Firmicutes bacterium]|nr:HAD hydrolase family protein [Bacillota bacterium]
MSSELGPASLRPVGRGGRHDGFRLVALDIDHTLVGDDNEIAARDLAAVRQCLAMGIEVVLATGRTRPGTIPIARQIGEGIPMICTTGGVTYNGRGEVIRRATVPLTLARDVLDRWRREGIPARADAAGTVYYTSAPPARWLVPGAIVDPDLADHLSKAPDQLVVWGEDGCRWTIRHLSYLSADVQLLVLPSWEEPRVVHVLHPRASKGAALADYCHSRGIDRSQVLAIGDSLNDFSLLSFAGTGIAMGHCEPMLRLVADVVLDAGEAVADALYAYVLSAGGRDGDC